MASAVAPTAAELATFSQRTKFVIPTSAQPLRFYSVTGWMDDAMWLQFRLPVAEFQQFISASSIPPALVRPGPTGSESALYYFLPWLPTAPKNFQYADAQIEAGRCVKCVFDFDDPRTATIYIMWIQM